MGNTIAFQLDAFQNDAFQTYEIQISAGELIETITYVHTMTKRAVVRAVIGSNKSYHLTKVQTVAVLDAADKQQGA